MTDQETWLYAVKRNKFDPLVRGVYADWLDEHGQVEEADRQRKWVDAFNRLKKTFFTDLWHPDDDPLPDDDQLLLIFEDWTRQAVDEREIIFAACGYGDQQQDEANGNGDFLPDLAVVTGLPVPLDLGRSNYHCSC